MTRTIMLHSKVDQHFLFKYLPPELKVKALKDFYGHSIDLSDSDSEDDIDFYSTPTKHRRFFSKQLNYNRLKRQHKPEPTIQKANSIPKKNIDKIEGNLTRCLIIIPLLKVY